MLRYLRGQLTHLDEHATLEVSGLGYEVRVSAQAIARLHEKLGDEIVVYIHEHLTETAHTLYGFENISELEFFRLLLTADKVGPSKALLIMSLGTPTQLMQAVRMGNAKYFQRASGVGESVANNVVLALEKVAHQEPKAH